MTDEADEADEADETWPSKELRAFCAKVGTGFALLDHATSEGQSGARDCD